MATVCSPPSPPPPPPCSSGENQSRSDSPPCPKHAAVPWSSGENPPGQENGSPGEGFQGAAAPSQLSEQNGPTQEQEDSLSDTEEKWPVQETDPAREALEGSQLLEAPELQHEGGNDQHPEDDLTA